MVCYIWKQKYLNQSFFFKDFLGFVFLSLHFRFLLMPSLFATGSPLSDMAPSALSLFLRSWIVWCTANCSRWKRIINPCFSREFYWSHLSYLLSFWTITETELSLDSTVDYCFDFNVIEVTCGVGDVLPAGNRCWGLPSRNVGTEELVDFVSDCPWKNFPCPWSGWSGRFDVIIGFKLFSVLKKIT